MSERREKEADAEVAKNGPAGKLARVRVNLDRTADVVMRDHFHLVRTVDGSDIRENFRARGGRSIERGVLDAGPSYASLPYGRAIAGPWSRTPS